MRAMKMFLIAGWALFLCFSADASHIKSCVLRWTRTANPREVEFTLRIGYDRSAFGSPQIGDIIQDGIGGNVFDFGDGSGEFTINVLRVLSYSAEEDWILCEPVSLQCSMPNPLIHTYSADGSYDAFYRGWSRVGNLNNRQSFFLTAHTAVLPQGLPGSGSPVIDTPPVIWVDPNDARFHIPISNGSLEIPAPCDAGVPVDAQDCLPENPQWQNPPNLNYNPAANEWFWDITGLDSTRYWTAQVVCRDADGASSVADFLLKIKDIAVEDWPAFEDQNGNLAWTEVPLSTFNITAGQPSTFEVNAYYGGAYWEPFSVTSTPLPLGMTVQYPLPVTRQPGGESWIWTDMEWTPSLAQAGSTFIFHFITMTPAGHTRYPYRINVLPPVVSPGSLDTSFGTGFNSTVKAVSYQHVFEGSILIGGDFTTYNGVTRNHIARLYRDGSVDWGFAPNVNGTVNAIAVQKDGKIVLAGSFTSIGGVTYNRVVRLTTGGAVDTTFNIGTGANSTINTAALQSDGKIIIGGLFTTFNGTPHNYIVRLNSDGSVDTTYNPSLTASVYSIAIPPCDSSGAHVIGGLANLVGGRNYYARLYGDGSLDTSFGSAVLNNTPLAIAIQRDGKFVLGGPFSSINGNTAYRYIGRLDAAGALDTSFNPGTGFNGGYVRALSLQSDGKILAGGSFTSYNGQARNYVARVNTDGTLDTGFNPGSGANSTVLSTALQADGKLIIGGSFTAVNGTGRNRIARLYAY